jgi:LPXTG-motif cell wall-anchored protein
MRICVVGALTVGIALTVLAGASYAAGHIVGQTTGYGAPQVLGEQFIKPKNAGSSTGLWFGLLVALVILGAAGFFGWRRTHDGAETV